MAEQVKTGKAFEYALLKEFYNRLNTKDNNLQVIESEPYFTAKKAYESFNETEQGRYNIVSSSAVNFLIDIEPRLSYSLNKEDILQLEIVSDSYGQKGDVRDVLAIRLLQKWEIGVSAKNNHRAVKHSRLSQTINFGKEWLGIPCSEEYFKEIEPIFTLLKNKRSENSKALWSEIDNMHEVIYKPILNAFRNELMRLGSANGSIVSQKLVEYLIGNKDFYKIIKSKKGVEIQAYNLHGTLNQSIKKIEPKAKAPKLKLPDRLIELVYKKDSTTTLVLALSEGWQISFRIHNASSRIEPSLKFDINLVSTPHTLFTNHIFISEN